MKKESSRLALAFAVGVGSVAVAVTIGLMRNSMSAEGAIYSLLAAVVFGGAFVLVLGLARSRARGKPSDDASG